MRAARRRRRRPRWKGEESCSRRRWRRRARWWWSGRDGPGARRPPVVGAGPGRERRRRGRGRRGMAAATHGDSVAFQVPAPPPAAYPAGEPMDARPRNLRAMLSESKDLSELMVDLAYAALYFGDPGHGGGDRRARGPHVRARARDAGGVRAGRPPPEGGRGHGLGPPGDLVDRAHRQRRRRHRPDRHPPPRHPPRARGRPVQRRGGVAPGPHPRGEPPGPPPARRAGAAGADGHARRGHPPRARLDHRRRRRRDLPPGRRDLPPGLTRGHLPAARAGRRAALGAARRRPRTARCPTSTAPSTSSSR